jgi:hypothetical protein
LPSRSHAVPTLDKNSRPRSVTAETEAAGSGCELDLWTVWPQQVAAAGSAQRFQARLK